MSAPASKTLPITVRQTRIKVPDRRHEPDLPDLLTPAEVAEYLRVKVETVHAWCRDGRLPSTKISEKRIRIERWALLDFMRAKSA